MEITVFLAQFWGWMLIILSGIFLVRGKPLIEEMLQSIGDRGFTLSSGYIAFVIGLVTVILNNIWTADWVGVVTLFGWISLLKGVIRIGFPETAQKMVLSFRGKTNMMQGLLIITLAVGVGLIISV